MAGLGGDMKASVVTARLRLRRACENDLAVYCQRIYADPKVMQNLPGGVPLPLDVAIPRARSHLMYHWQQHGFGPWLVVAGDYGRIVGHCGLRYWPGTRDVEVLYALEPSAWGKGYATEAAGASVEIGFSELLLQRIVAGALPGNRGSLHVMEKLGMQRWETRELDDIEVIMYQITRAGWRAERA